MSTPIPGMKTVPVGLDKVQGADFIACVVFVSKSRAAWDRFEKETGHRFPDDRELKAMDLPLVAAFADWVCVNV